MLITCTIALLAFLQLPLHHSFAVMSRSEVRFPLWSFVHHEWAGFVKRAHLAGYFPPRNTDTGAQMGP